MVEQAYQRHLAPDEYVDNFIGELIERMERNGSYDDALVVVTADHGTAIRPRTLRRIIAEDNVGRRGRSPALRQTTPRLGHGAGRTTGRSRWTSSRRWLRPSGIDVPWEVDGVDLFGDDPHRTESTMIGSDQPVTFGVAGTEKLDVARYHLEWFGDRGPYGLVPSGYADLFGADLFGAGLDGLTITESPQAGSISTSGTRWSISMKTTFPR